MPTLQLRRNDRRRHLVVCGDSPLAFRLVDELINRYDEDVTVILRSKQENYGPRIAQLTRVKVIEATAPDNNAFQQAKLGTARALALLGSDDAGNIHAALLAQDINPDLRLVLRLFNTSLGHRVRTLFTDCAVLSDAAMAAPSFVAASLGREGPTHIRVSGRTLYVVRRDEVEAQRIICGLADTSDQAHPDLLPVDEHSTDLVLAFANGSDVEKAVTPRRRKWLTALRRNLGSVFNRRVGVAALSLFVLLAIGTTMFATFGGYTWWNAIYETALDVAGAAQPLDSLPVINKITQVMVTIVGISIIPIITAVALDAVVSARLAAAAGPKGPFHDHVVVIGLGQVGVRVIAQLHDLGVPVVGIDRNESARGVPLAKRLGIPVVIGDASRDDTLRAAYIGTSRALVTLSSHDVVNLEAALTARAIRHDLTVVLRLFDNDFARLVERRFNINVSRSVSSLAAPAFAAAMVERQVIGTIPVGRRVLLIAEVPVGDGTGLNGMTVRQVEQRCEVRVIGLQRRTEQRLDWQSAADHQLVPRDRLMVVATRSGLGQILASSI
ncbi:NAD-binding protein [Kutzneria sp. CA-103260]|uniref:NAD-binding protein n=1 Tax=Kutzneria sp. CA-103260 TaxID=2802641 RepID=UPI001BACBE88|nr:NAD-binding protein [Kutzneria sp. CA-103260]